MSIVQIYPPSSEWQYTLFQLQIILADPSIQIQKITKHNNEFGDQYAANIKIDAALQITDKNQEQVSVLKYGNPSKAIFEAGHIKVKPTDTKKIRKILLFKLAIGNILPIHKSGQKQLEKISDFPQGIDTIYISQNKDELNIYPHKYRVRSKKQCLLQYQVQYRIKGVDNMKKWIRDQQKCETCNIQKAIYYCQNDGQIYCVKCYDQGHQSYKKHQHTKEQVSPYNSTSYCTSHSGNRLSYYCLNCRQLKCEKCLKVQGHNKTDHEVYLLTELFSVLKQKQDYFVGELKSKLKQLILRAEQGIKKLTRQYQIQQKDLQQHFALKLSKIRQEHNTKLSKNISLHCQLKRKYDKVLWVENFINFTQKFILVEDSIHVKQSYTKFLQDSEQTQYLRKIQKDIIALQP